MIKFQDDSLNQETSNAIQVQLKNHKVICNLDR